MKIGEKLQELGFVGVMEMRSGALEMEYAEMVEVVEVIRDVECKQIIFDNDVVFHIGANTVL